MFGVVKLIFVIFSYLELWWRLILVLVTVALISIRCCKFKASNSSFSLVFYCLICEPSSSIKILQFVPIFHTIVNIFKALPYLYLLLTISTSFPIFLKTLLIFLIFPQFYTHRLQTILNLNTGICLRIF